MRVRLTVTEGPHQGRDFVFTEHDRFLVGRSRQAHFRLQAKDRYFSRLHFMIEVNPPHCRLSDLGSRNGTYVNGRKVAAIDLQNGDLIKGGATVLQVSVEAGEDAETAETAKSEAAPAATSFHPAPPGRPPPSPGAASSSQPPPLPPPLPDAARPPLGKDCVGCGAAGAAPLCADCRWKAERLAQPVPGYQMVKELGRGGMGVVWLALRDRDGLPVAVKTVTPAVAGTPAQLERFLREARILQHLIHPRIVSFLDMGQAAGRLFFAMEYVRGSDAAQLLKKQKGPLPVARAVGLICQALEGLEYAHTRGIVHRDIKPHNLLVAADPRTAGGDLVKVADFGLARAYQSSNLSGLTADGEMAGTAPFMAPEQITSFREARPPVDLYAAGATLYYLLARQFIYDLPPLVPGQVLMILSQDPVPIQQRRPDLPGKLAEAVHRSLRRDPADRFPDARAMRAALAPFA
jgi:serine/threonine-protein kinase